MKILNQSLTACEALLHSAGETFWAEKIQPAQRKFGDSIDIYLLEEILSWYGGMGSFNDLMIFRHNNHTAGKEDEEEFNN